ncbi:MAG TPA: PAS domain S-box protein [Candidatus Binatia bacterium]|jgi:PAS domain S-box-containing protein
MGQATHFPPDPPAADFGFQAMLLAQASDAVIAVDNQERITYFNAAAEKQYGVTAAEALGRPLEEIYRYSWPRARDKAAAFAAIAANGSWRGENFHVRNDGTTIQVESEVSALKDKHGRQVGMLAVIRDITRRKLSEEALRAKEAQLRLVTDYAPVMLAHRSRDRRYLFVNHAYAQRFGLTPDEITGRTVAEVVGAQTYAQICPYIDRVLAGEPVAYESETHDAETGSRFISVSYIPEKDDQGGILGWVSAMTDVTARRQAEDALRESRQRLRLAMEGAELGLWERNLDTGAIVNSERALRVFGRPFTNVHDWESLIHPDDRERVRSVWQAAVSGVAQYNVEYRVMRPDGSMRWVLSKGALLRDEQGKKRLVGVAVDVTARKQAEEELRRRKDELTAFFENASIGLHWVGPEGIVEWANPAELKMLGYSREEYEGHHIAEFHVDRETIDDVLARLGRGERLANREARMRCKDGSVKDVVIDASVLWEEGRYVHTQCFTRDVTDQKRAERRLHLQYRVSRVIGEASGLNVTAAQILEAICTEDGWDSGALWLLDEVVNELRCIEIWHTAGLHAPAFRAVTAGSRFRPAVGLPGRVLNDGAPIWILDVTQDANFPRAQVARSEGLCTAFACPIRVENDVIGAMEFFSRIKRQPDADFLDLIGSFGAQIGQFIERRYAEDDLRRLNLELEARVRDRTAELIAANQALRSEMDERAVLEEQFRQAQKLESIGTLAGGIAHDFNNILNIIQGYASLMKESTDPTVAESLPVIASAVNRGSAVVQQLLTLARKTDPKLELIDVNALIRELDSLLKETFPKTVEVVLEPGDISAVRADANQMTQALLNLSLNARDAMPDGGKLTLKTVAVERKKIPAAADARADSYVCIEVMDTGLGMDETVRQRLFEPFFTTKGVGEGTGLGLAVVYGIIKNHDGFVEVQSRPRMGSTFRIYLPAAGEGDRPRVVAVPSYHESKRERAARGTILLVEDETIILRLLERTLSDHGYRVLTAVDGAEALEIYHARSSEIDLVVLDAGLPKIAGWNVFLKMKEANPSVRAVIASGYLEPELKSEMYRAGIEYFLQKPYVPTDVVDKLDRLLQDDG